MRRVLLLLVACSSTTPTARQVAEPAAGPPVIANKTETCTNAALGLERATKGVRAPESSVFEAMRNRCQSDSWPVTAVECFATMREGDLGRCAKQLPQQMRDAMFAVLGGGPPDRAAIAVARARLELLAVGVAECDRFVMTVSAMLACEGMPIEARVQLGNETADFWDLPTHGLSAVAQQRMSTVCGESLATLQQQAASVGCTL